MIGTNNLGSDEKPINSNDEIVAGVTKIVKELNEKLPKTKVLLLAIFPRDAAADGARRGRIKGWQVRDSSDGGAARDRAVAGGTNSRSAEPASVA